ncbi:MAG: sulfite exporter TauE/SafE family protein [Bacteroidetes bacterium]|nr:MAG: sulfite exporter TauE/SafE family protein [Bacteroidota bacterium]
MDSNIIFILVLVIIFCASLYRATFGFGDALIAMPLLALLINIKIATPIVAFMGFAVSVFILLGNRQKQNFTKIWQLVIFSIIGIPIGLFFLKSINENIVKIVLAFILIIYSLFSLTYPHLYLKTNKSAFAFGIISGILGSAYNTNGPPIIMYGTLRKWTPEEFRLLLQGVFLPTNMFIIIGHGFAGLWTGDVVKVMLYALPTVMTATIIGNILNKKIPSEKFEKLVYYFLIGIGMILLIQSIVKIVN